MQAVTITQITPPELETLIENLLKRVILDSQKPQERVDQWFDLDELCSYIPDKPAKPTVYGWVSRNETPYHKRGKKLYFLKSEIDAWLKSGRKKTVVELQTEADSYLGAKRKRS